MSLLVEARRTRRFLALLAGLVALGSCDRGPTDPPAVRQIAFASSSPDPYIDSYYIIGEDGSDERPLEAVPTGAHSLAWAAGGDRIAYVVNHNGRSAIVVASADGAVHTIIGGPPPGIPVDSFVGYVAPELSPDSRRIVFTASRFGRHELMIVNADGTGLTKLAGAPGESYHGPVWSPDGSRLALYMSISGTGTYGIHTMNPDGTGVTSLGVNGTSLSWAPDGRRIAYASLVDGNTDIYTIEVNGGAITRLTEDPERDFDPAWSPDGRTIAFASLRQRVSRIFTMNADGSNEARLMTKAWNNRQPVWRP